VLTLCTAEFAWKLSWFYTVELIDENIYSHRRGKVSNTLNGLDTCLVSNGSVS
jgi:hypothetical protein